MTSPAGWTAIDFMEPPAGSSRPDPGPAPTAAVTSDPMDGKGGKHLTIEVFGDADLEVTVNMRGTDGVYRAGQPTSFTAGQADTMSWPVSLGWFTITAEAAADGWRGYVNARVGS